jgi:hypothetical protein
MLLLLCDAKTWLRISESKRNEAMICKSQIKRIKRLFESKASLTLFGRFNFQCALIKLIPVGSADFCGELYCLLERQFFQQ